MLILAFAQNRLNKNEIQIAKIKYIQKVRDILKLYCGFFIYILNFIKTLRRKLF